jgi:hypothetical protein
MFYGSAINRSDPSLISTPPLIGCMAFWAVLQSAQKTAIPYKPQSWGYNPFKGTPLQPLCNPGMCRAHRANKGPPPGGGTVFYAEHIRPTPPGGVPLVFYAEHRRPTPPGGGPLLFYAEHRRLGVPKGTPLGWPLAGGVPFATL